METARCKQPAQDSRALSPGPSDASCRSPRSEQAQPLAAPAPPGSALPGVGEQPHLAMNPGAPTLTVQPSRTRPPQSRSRRVLNDSPPALPPPADRRANPGAAGRMAGQKRTREHAKLMRTQPANFWAAARNARRPEFFRSAEPSRRGCRAAPPRTVVGGPAALRRQSTCLTPGGRSPAQPQAATNSRERVRPQRQSTDPPLSRRGLGAARPAPAIPLGSLRRSLPTRALLPQAGCPQNAPQAQRGGPSLLQQLQPRAGADV